MRTTESTPQLSPEESERLKRALQRDVRPVLLTAGGDTIELPEAVNDLFCRILDSIKRNQTVLIVPRDEVCTTQAAANYLGVSRQFLVRLLKEGRIPYHQAGSHRRVLLQDLTAYQKERSKSRRAKLDQMTKEAVDAGVYDRNASTERGDDE